MAGVNRNCVCRVQVVKLWQDGEGRMIIVDINKW